LIQNISGEGIFDDSLDIVGGEVVNHGDAPWNARLNIIQGAGNWFKSFICSGSLINERWILTDAHCSYIYPDPFNRLLNFGMDVQLGVYNLSMKETSEVIISSSVKIKIFMHFIY
jgi:secreted trypsin-like serine protease